MRKSYGQYISVFIPEVPLAGDYSDELFGITLKVVFDYAKGKSKKSISDSLGVTINECLYYFNRGIDQLNKLGYVTANRDNILKSLYTEERRNRVDLSEIR